MLEIGLRGAQIKPGAIQKTHRILKGLRRIFYNLLLQYTAQLGAERPEYKAWNKNLSLLGSILQTIHMVTMIVGKPVDTKGILKARALRDALLDAAQFLFVGSFQHLIIELTEKPGGCVHVPHAARCSPCPQGL